jgi:hypothetical protein
MRPPVLLSVQNSELDMLTPSLQMCVAISDQSLSHLLQPRWRHFDGNDHRWCYLRVCYIHVL